jgi:hypothetical protein
MGDKMKTTKLDGKAYDVIVCWGATEIAAQFFH